MPNYKNQLHEAEKNIIIKLLVGNGFNKTKTAKEMGVTTKTLFNKINELGIDLNMVALESAAKLTV